MSMSSALGIFIAMSVVSFVIDQITHVSVIVNLNRSEIDVI